MYSDLDSLILKFNFKQYVTLKVIAAFIKLNLYAILTPLF